MTNECTQHNFIKVRHVWESLEPNCTYTASYKCQHMEEILVCTKCGATFNPWKEVPDA